MRIAYLSDSNIPSKKANSVHVMNMCHAFNKMGHEVTLFGLKNRIDGDPDIWEWYGTEAFGLELHGYEIPKLRLWIHAWQTVRKLKKLKPDVVFGRSLFACLQAAKAGIPVCYETHDPMGVLNKQQSKAFEELLKSDKLLGVVVLSKALKDILLSETDKIKPDQILAAHDGATVLQLNKESLNTYDWPAQNSSRRQVGYVGTISQGRGIELILELSDLLPQVDFHIIGGNKSDLSKLGVPENRELPNVFFHGFVSPREAAIARKKCDVLLAPYQEDIKLRSGKNTSKYMSPLKIFEYMEAGKPVICSDLPVLREVLEDDLNALMVQATNVEDWKKSVERLINDRDLCERIGGRGNHDLMNKYTWQIRANEILSFIKENEKI
ncbi:MAG: glycosyltransferase family 4 protein [Roseivirga sp.]|nr:glycosyltransferase family 4 protein [Roseivirga sp.]